MRSINDMKALSFWKAAALYKSNFLDEILALLEDRGIRFCRARRAGRQHLRRVIGQSRPGLGCRAPSDDELRSLLAERFGVEVLPHSISVSLPGSNVRVQIQTDSRHADFVGRASMREVLGLRPPVASIEDVLPGKIWAALHPEGRATNRKKDLLDIEQLLEAYPALKSRVPKEIVEPLA